MNILFLKIVSKEILDDIKEIRDEIKIRHEAIEELKKVLGANSCREYNRGGIAFFTFSKEVDRKIWKKAHDGFYPKAKTKELDLIRNLPVAREYIDSVKSFGFGNEMVMGKSDGTKFPMYSTSIAGNHDTGLFYLKVPYGDKAYNREIDPAFEVVKEWEMMKEMEQD